MVFPDLIAVGVDFGQRHDPTAIVVAEVCRRPTGDIHHYRCRFAPNGPPLAVCDEYCMPVEEGYYRVRHVERPRLGTRYEDIAVRLTQMVNSVADITTPIYGRTPLHVICDETGLGGPALEIVENAVRNTDARLTGVTLTAGSKPDVTIHRRRGTMPKSWMVNRLAALFETGRIVIAPGTLEAGVLRSELQDFQRHMKRPDSDHVSYDARTGSHDDTITALGLACFHDPVRGRMRTIPMPDGWA